MTDAADDKARIAKLEHEVKQITHRLDQVLRLCGLPPFIDEQLAAINARQAALSRGEAA